MQKVWLKHFPKGIPESINENMYQNIPEVFEAACKKFGNLPAFCNMGVSLSFSEMDQLTKQFANFLIYDLKLQKGDRIAIQMPNLLQTPIAIFGALRAGLVVVNTNPLYTPREMKHQFNNAQVKAVVILENFASQLEEILSETEIQHVVLTEIGDQLKFPKKCLVNFVVKHIKKMVPPHKLKNPYRFHQALDLGKKHTFKKTDIKTSDIAFLQYTGGTTGVSKGAILTHKNITCNMIQVMEWMKPKLVEGQECAIAALPLYHIFSLTVNCLAFMAFGACNILITNPKDIPGFIKELKKHKFSIFVGVNTLYNGLMNHKDFSSLNFSSLKISVAGGMALQKAVADKWFKLTGCKVIEGYGLTETSPLASCNPVDGTDRTGTIGIPVSSTDMKIIDDNGKELGFNQPGEICIKGPQVMQGYWQTKEETDKVMTSDGWFKSGDIGIVDESGFFKIVDRKKDMILVSGFNVYPNEIEDVLALHPKILEVAAVGVPDEKSNEAVKVFIVKKDESLSKEEVMAYAHKNLTGYKLPKHIEFKKELPKTNVGKILRRALRDG